MPTATDAEPTPAEWPHGPVSASRLDAVFFSGRKVVVSAVGVLGAAILLHEVQMTFAGYELVRFADGHGLELLPLFAVSLPPAFTLALTVVVTIVVVRRFVLGHLLAAPMPLAASQPVRSAPPLAVAASRVSALSRHLAERAPPHVAR